MPTISHGKLSIHYLEWGNPGDPVIILVHGVLLSSPMFEPLATRLKGWRVIGVDVRGHGGSSRPRQSRCYSWRLFASDVRALMDELGIEKAVIGGVSLGANVALEFAHLFPARVRALVIEMPVLSASEGPARYTFVSAGKALRRFGRFLGVPAGLVRKLVATSRYPELVVLRNTVSMDLLATAALIDGIDQSPITLHDAKVLAAIDVPTLVIGHRFDPLHHRDDAVHLAAKIPGAEFASNLTLLDFRLFPSRYAKAVLEFLNCHFAKGARRP